MIAGVTKEEATFLANPPILNVFLSRGSDQPEYNFFSKRVIAVAPIIRTYKHALGETFVNKAQKLKKRSNNHHKVQVRFHL